jgi:predicted transport protein/uncharacterized protein YihD (DUF1040 family)
MKFATPEIGQLFELLDKSVTALDGSIESKEKGAYVCYEFADMQGKFLCMRPFKNCINVEMDMPGEKTRDPQRLCKISSRPSMWNIVVTVTLESDINYIRDLVKQAYDNNLQTEVINMTTEMKPSVQEMIDKFKSVLKKSSESLDRMEMLVKEDILETSGFSKTLAESTQESLIRGEIRACYKDLERICNDYSV